MKSSVWYEWFTNRPWAIEIILAAFLLFLLHLLIKKTLSHVQNKSNLKKNDWRYHLDYVVLTPCRTLLWILLISIAFDLAIRQLSIDGAFYYFTPMCNTAIVCCVTWFLLRWKKVIHIVVTSGKSLKGELAIDPFTFEILEKGFTVLILFITLLIVMQLFGLNILPLITFGGIGAATLGFAGKDAIANFFGGLMIYLTRPFIIQDLIEIPDKKIVGYVEEIGWYFTSIRDMQKKPVYIPNSVFSTEALINQSRMTHRRIDERIGIQQTDLEKIPKIVETIDDFLKSHPSIDITQTIYVSLERLEQSSFQILIQAYNIHTRYESFMKARQEILLSICRIILEKGAVLSSPSLDVFIRSPE